MKSLLILAIGLFIGVGSMLVLSKDQEPPVLYDSNVTKKQESLEKEILGLKSQLNQYLQDKNKVSTMPASQVPVTVNKEFSESLNVEALEKRMREIAQEVYANQKKYEAENAKNIFADILKEGVKNIPQQTASRQFTSSDIQHNLEDPWRLGLEEHQVETFKGILAKSQESMREIFSNDGPYSGYSREEKMKIYQEALEERDREVKVVFSSEQYQKYLTRFGRQKQVIENSLNNK